MIELYIGNKNYSSWSMRAWLVLEHFQIPYIERFVPFDDFDHQQPFKQLMTQISPTGKVPTLVDQFTTVWDSLAICEYLADIYPDKKLWPKNIHQRAQARAMCAEMHSGFQSLRHLCGMNIEADLSDMGVQHWEKHERLRLDVQRIEEIWASRTELDGFLSGDQFTIVDAFYAPVVMRLVSFKLPVSEHSHRYMQTIINVLAVQKWMRLAQQEHLFVPIDEPYRDKPTWSDQS